MTFYTSNFPAFFLHWCTFVPLNVKSEVLCYEVNVYKLFITSFKTSGGRKQRAGKHFLSWHHVRAPAVVCLFSGRAEPTYPQLPNAHTPTSSQPLLASSWWSCVWKRLAPWAEWLVFRPSYLFSQFMITAWSAHNLASLVLSIYLQLQTQNCVQNLELAFVFPCLYPESIHQPGLTHKCIFNLISFIVSELQRKDND